MLKESNSKVMIRSEIDIDIVTEKFEFASEKIMSKFRGAKNSWATEAYVYLLDKKIVSFVLMMEEDLKCGFLHYHINEEHKDYFIVNYPVINRKTNQILYVYTEVNFRRKGMASRLVEFVISDMSNRNYSYVWLKKETDSQIYNRLDFQNFIDAMHEIFIDAEAFFREYEKKFGYKKSSLIDRYNDVRLVGRSRCAAEKHHQFSF